MKRRGVLLALLLAAALLAVLGGCKKPLTGHISAFRYQFGHPWDGYDVYTTFTENDIVYAKLAFQATDGMAYPKESWEVSLALTDEETAAFDQLLLETLRLPDWAEGYENHDIYDDNSWSITYTWDGAEYATGGYAVFPEGLQQISAFFASLDWPDQP